MADDSTISAVLKQLDGIANAPLTRAQRETRARPVIEGAGVSVPELLSAIGRERLPWTRDKARECGVEVRTWLRAIQLVARAEEESVSALLDRIHQAESAVAMLRAGYDASLDTHGRLTWTRS